MWILLISPLFNDREKVDIDAGTDTEKNLFHELYYHILGTDQSEDVLCWRNLEHPQWLSRAEITSDGQVSELPLL